jgi:voltage-gated potassium channel
MLHWKIIRPLLFSAGLLCLTVSVGIIGYHLIEGYDVLDAMYMTVITMSTVGYEILGNDGLSDDGKLFTIFLIIFTIGVFTYTVTTMTTFMVEGEIRNFFKGYRVNKEISKIRNHILVCGLGRNGKQAALELIHEGAPFVAIERDQDVIDSFHEEYPSALILKGDATDEDVLIAANLAHAKGVISALADDAANVFVTLSIRQLNPKVPVVARAANESTIKKLEVAGANRVVLPNILGGRQMAKVLTKPALMDFVDLVTGTGQFHLNLEMIECADNPKLVGKTMAELDIRSKTGVLVLGLQDSGGNFSMNPDAREPIQRNQKLFVIGNDTQIVDFKRQFE